MKKKLRVLIAGGGTGGHLFPGIAIAEEILSRKPESDIRFVGTKQGLEYKTIPKMNIPLYVLPVSGLYRVGFVKKVKTLLKLPFAFLQSLAILIRFRPHLVIGVGGYASGPMLLMSLFCFRNIIIQEQNASPGMTNRFLGKVVPLAFVPFKGLEKVFRRPFVVGNPIRKKIRDLVGKPNNRKNEPFQILLFGGSQGAHILNMTMIKTLPLLKDYSDQIQILHQTGKNDYDEVNKAYAESPIQAVVSPFISNMDEAYAESHLMICRAGSSVSEIIAVGRASITVPIPNSSGDHQKKNAETLQNADAGILIEQKDLTPNLLAEKIIDLLKNSEKIDEMEKKAKALYQGDATSAIVDHTFQYFQF